MSDCCGFRITYHCKDAEAIVHHLGLRDGMDMVCRPVKPYINEYVVEEANYGLIDGREKLALKTDVSCYGICGRGGAWNETLFVIQGHEHVSVDTIDGIQPACAVRESSDNRRVSVNEQDLTQAKRYFKLKKEVEKAWKLANTPAPRWVVLHKTLLQGWLNTWTEQEEGKEAVPLTFKTKEEAELELAEYLRQNHRLELGHKRSEFRIVRLQTDANKT